MQRPVLVVPNRTSNDQVMTLDVEAVRSCFPALASGVAHFDGPGGSQTPQAVAGAIADTMCAGLANRGSVTEAERRAERIVINARAAVGDLLGTAPGGVVFGRSMTAVTFELSRALAKQWAPGDEIVVTRLDHDANIRPWVIAAEHAGARVRWADFDPATGDLTVEAVAGQLSARTRLVAVTGASNLIGTRPDLAAISAAVHEAGALVYVDGVHLTPHASIDLAESGADFFACSPYKFFGPHHGLVAAAPALLETLSPDKLMPSTDAVPERFELGTLPYELLAGTTAAIDFIAGLAHGSGDRRTRLRESMAALEGHEDALFRRLLDGLAELPELTVHGKPERRTPTVLFTHASRSPQEVAHELAGQKINAPASHFYALEASRRLGLGDVGGVRVGLAPYTNDDEIDRLLDALSRL